MIDQETINKIAKLARLKITQSEAEEYQDQLSKVLTHFQQISAIDTKDIEPMVTSLEEEAFLREDIHVSAEINTEEILKNSPDRAGNLFKVPPVV